VLGHVFLVENSMYFGEVSWIWPVPPLLVFNSQGGPCK
jgi:hypothetical protein